MWLWDQGADRVCYKDKMENEVKISKSFFKSERFSSAFVVVYNEDNNSQISFFLLYNRFGYFFGFSFS